MTLKSFFFSKMLFGFFLVMLWWPTGVHASLSKLETVGRTYQIAEPDFLEEVQKRAAEVDWGKVMDKEKMKERVKNFQPEDMQKLPKAMETRTYPVDPTYHLEFDIPNPNNPAEILYPRGYAFNPLDYKALTSIIVLIDGSDPDQVAWFETTPYLEDQRTKVLLSDGNYFELMKRWKRPVFYLFVAHAKRLQVEAVPAVVIQKNRMLEVTEYYVEAGFAKHQEAKANAEAGNKSQP